VEPLAESVTTTRCLQIASGWAAGGVHEEDRLTISGAWASRPPDPDLAAMKPAHVGPVQGAGYVVCHRPRVEKVSAGLIDFYHDPEAHPLSTPPQIEFYATLASIS